MANTSSRTLRLLSLLQTHRYWPGEELAARLEVSIRTLRRDVDRLRELGYPVQAQRGVDGGYQLTPGAALPPLVLDDDEAVALAVGLLAAAASPISGVAEASVAALAKVVQVMPNRLRRRIDAVTAMTEPVPLSSEQPRIDPDALTTIAQACRDNTRIEFGYTAADGTASRRRADPHRLVSVGRRWYLVAYDLSRHDWRSFRLDRATSITTTGERFAPRTLPADDAAQFVQNGLRSRPREHVVRAKVDAPAEEVRARIGRWVQVSERRDGTCTVRVSVEHFEWAAATLGLTGADFHVQGPPAFVDYLGEWSQRYARAVAPAADREAVD